MEENLLNIITQKLTNELDDLILEGLKLKGFEFENKNQLYDFIKTRCRREDYIESKEHVYYVDNLPFFLHKYEVIYEPISLENNEIKLNANYGKYSFL